MEQCKKIVLEAPEGMTFVTSQGENGEIVIRLMSNPQIAGKAAFFIKITETDRQKVENWIDKQKAIPDWASEFMKIVRKAICTINYDYWIAILEPVVKNGMIGYDRGENVGVEYSIEMWNKMAKDYAPERGSRMGTIYELFMWYALRIANGLWTLEYVAHDSSSAGNFWDVEDSSHELENTSTREIGGYEDGQGNTCKIVRTDDGYAIIGGSHNYKGKQYPVASVSYKCDAKTTHYSAVGVVVMKN